MFWIPGEGPVTDDRYLGDELIRAIATGRRMASDGGVHGIASDAGDWNSYGSRGAAG